MMTITWIEILAVFGTVAIGFLIGFFIALVLWKFIIEPILNKYF